MPDLFSLEGRAALVTGGASGIGKAISLALAKAGARVMIGDIDVEAAESAAVELEAVQTGAAHVPLDVADERSAVSAVEKTREHFGRIDILVNNAGVNTVHGRVTIDRYLSEDWRRVLAVDLDGVFFMSRAVAALMKETGGGRIINIASVLGIVPARLQSAFVAAKAAVINLTRSMALELAPDRILVNCIAPGSTLTEGTRKLFYSEDAAYQEKIQSLLSHIPLARPGEAEEIAAAAVFLAAPASSYITGIVLPVDGGWTAGYLRDW